MTLPNFYIVGGARCGSTSLSAYCEEHPEIFMSQVKEPNFFSYGYGKVDFSGPNRHFYQTSIKSMTAYRKLFAEAGKAKAIGEASINYMLHPEACAGIRKETPKAKLVFILRQPVERAWSSFQRSLIENREKESDFIKAWQDDGRRRDAGYWANIHRYKSLYGRHLKFWLHTFPRNQIKVILFDDFREDTLGTMRDLYSFLGVDPDFEPDTSVVHNPSGVLKNPLLKYTWNTVQHMPLLVALVPLKWRGKGFRFIASRKNIRKPEAKLPPELKKALTEELREDILQLQELIGRDLSIWL